MSKIDKIDWGLKARVLELLIDYKRGGMKERDRLTRIVERAIKAASRYRRLMKWLKRGFCCPLETQDYNSKLKEYWREHKRYNCDGCGIDRPKKDKCWRLFEKKELDGEN